MTKNGFVSIIADCMSPDRVIVRAHKAEHIEALFPHQGWGTIELMSQVFRGEFMSADSYLYRTFITRDQLRQMLLNQVDELDIGTFRHGIVDPIYYDACSKARRQMYRLDSTIAPSFWRQMDGEEP